MTGLNKKEIFGVRVLLVRKNKIWDQQQERLLYCGILPSSSLVPSFLLVSRRSPLASWLPVVFLFCPWCCSESEDSVINLRIQHSNCLWYLFDFLIPCAWSPSQVSLRYNLSSNSLYLHTLPTSKLHQQNRFFLWGSWSRHSCL